MARVARIIVPGFPHHVTQRGNRRLNVFLDDQDRAIFLRLLEKTSEHHLLKNLSYCLMDNHFHLVSVPQDPESLSVTMQKVLGPYATYFNQKYGLGGRLWQGRFYTCVLDDSRFWAAVRYVERNPVRAGIVQKAEDYPWSSAPAHCGLKQDPLLAPFPVNRDLIPDWSVWLFEKQSESESKSISHSTRTGRPLGSDPFVEKLESMLGRPLRPRKGGRPRKQKTGNE
ncbi:MAG: transposase [Acidobacteria bacterium]|nr:transposase [Acidobacteriota bacterium]